MILKLMCIWLVFIQYYQSMLRKIPKKRRSQGQENLKWFATMQRFEVSYYNLLFKQEVVAAPVTDTFVLAIGTQVRGFTPGRSRRIFRAKKSSARLSSEEK
jgi:hypothetical protein